MQPGRLVMAAEIFASDGICAAEALGMRPLISVGLRKTDHEETEHEETDHKEKVR